MVTALPPPTPAAPGPSDPSMAPAAESLNLTPLILVAVLGVALGFAFYLLMKKSAAARKVSWEQQLALTGVTPRAAVAEGWYPTPTGEQERYFDGEAWTKEYRPREIEGAQPAVRAADDRLGEEEAARLLAQETSLPLREDELA